VCQPVRGTHLLRRNGEHLPLVVAADRRQGEREQPVAGLAGLQPTRQQVAQVHRDVRRLARNVIQHRLQSPEVAVHV